jgi:hemerythrin
MRLNEAQMPMVAVPSMNDTHLEDIIMINRMLDLIEQDERDAITDLLERFMEHTKVHFSTEEAMMLEAGFPPYPMHKNEHDNALNQLHDVKTYWEKTADIDSLHHYFDTVLPEWFMQHVGTMDTVTAQFLSKGTFPSH